MISGHNSMKGGRKEFHLLDHDLATTIRKMNVNRNHMMSHVEKE